MSSSSSFTRRNKRKIADAETSIISPKSQMTLRRFSFGVLVVLALFVAGLSWAFSSSSSSDNKPTKPRQITSAANPESLDPLARLNHVIPSQPNAVAGLAAMESFSPSNNNLMLVGFGGGGEQGQQTTTVDYIYDGQNMVRTRKNGGPGATYLTGPRGPEYRRDDVTGQVRWYLPDGLGSVAGEVDPMGNVTSSRKYDAFGNVRGGNNPGGTSKHKFVGALGHLSEDQTGLIYMRSRYYDPVSGRFINQDPVYHGFNWFAYASSNPINRIDPNGREDMAEELESSELSQELQGENGTAVFGAAKWFNSKTLVKEFMERLNLTRGQASDAIHELKKFNG